MELSLLGWGIDGRKSLEMPEAPFVLELEGGGR
jgi:hypothetical protein